MERRLSLVLHLDQFDLVVGGGWSEYDSNDRIVNMEAFPGLGDGRILPEEGAELLLEAWHVTYAKQMQLPGT